MTGYFHSSMRKLFVAVVLIVAFLGSDVFTHQHSNHNHEFGLVTVSDENISSNKDVGQVDYAAVFHESHRDSDKHLDSDCCFSVCTVGFIADPLICASLLRTETRLRIHPQYLKTGSQSPRTKPPKAAIAFG